MIHPGDTFEAPSSGHPGVKSGIYVALEPAPSKQWRCLVLVGDSRFPEREGQFTTVNAEWLLDSCERLS